MPANHLCSLTDLAPPLTHPAHHQQGFHDKQHEKIDYQRKRAVSQPSLWMDVAGAVRAICVSFYPFVCGPNGHLLTGSTVVFSSLVLRHLYQPPHIFVPNWHNPLPPSGCPTHPLVSLPSYNITQTSHDSRSPRFEPPLLMCLALFAPFALHFILLATITAGTPSWAPRHGKRRLFLPSS